MQSSQFLNAVPLQHAVLCAECDVVSDSPHDVCMVCGSRSLFNIARVFGGGLPKRRASVVGQEPVTAPSDVLLIFPKPHKVRRRAVVGLRQPPVAPDVNETCKPEPGMLVGPNGR